MGAFGGPNVVDDSLVFYYDTFNELKSYKGEPTVNYITTVAANLGGNVSLSYPNNVYICTAQETNVIDPTAPGGQYSRFTGNTDSDNNQLFTSFVDGSVNARNTTVAYSVYLKGTGTCHLTVYSDIAGYSITPTITLTSEWTRYSIVQAVGNYTTHAWAAVRGILTSTNVYVAAQQVEFNSHVTPFVNGTRSATQGLLDLTGNSTIDLTNVSFDSNAQMTFDGTNDYIQSTEYTVPATGPFTVEFVYRISTVGGRGGLFERNPNSPYNGMSLGQGGAGNWAFNISDTFNGTLLSAAFTYPTQNVWYHDVGVFNGSNTVQSYRNGVLVNTTTAGTVGNIDTQGTRDKLLVMKRDNNSSTVGGDVALVKVYNRALTAAEVTQNYQAVKSRFGI